MVLLLEYYSVCVLPSVFDSGMDEWVVYEIFPSSVQD